MGFPPEGILVAVVKGLYRAGRCNGRDYLSGDVAVPLSYSYYYAIRSGMDMGIVWRFTNAVKMTAQRKDDGADDLLGNTR